MPTIVAPDDALLAAVVEQVWTSMLHEPPLPWPTAWYGGRHGVQAALAVSGDWGGVLRLWCADAAAVSMTRAMLMLADCEHPGLDDVEDALGEVLNIVAGSLKGALGGSSSLGLPTVTRCPAPAPTDSHIHQTVSWHDEPVLISIVPTR